MLHALAQCRRHSGLDMGQMPTSTAPTTDTMLFQQQASPLPLLADSTFWPCLQLEPLEERCRFSENSLRSDTSAHQ